MSSDSRFTRLSLFTRTSAFLLFCLVCWKSNEKEPYCPFTPLVNNNSKDGEFIPLLRVPVDFNEKLAIVMKYQGEDFRMSSNGIVLVPRLTAKDEIYLANLTDMALDSGYIASIRKLVEK